MKMKKDTSKLHILVEGFKPKNFFRLKLKDILISLGIFIFITFISFFFAQKASDPTLNIAMLYTIGVMVVSSYTDGHIYGILFSFGSVLAVNFYFTYPYLDFNFTLEGYQVTFISMLLIALLASITGTVIKQQKEVLSKQQEELQEAEKERMRANLLRAVSHDLRTPLTGIIGNSSSYLELEDQMVESEKNKIVSSIKEDANWLLNMVENLLSVTKVNADSAKINTQVESVDEVIASAISKFKKRFPEAKINVSLPDEIIMCKMDIILIEQVVLNILQNSVFHSKSDKDIDFNVFEKDGMVEFHIRDYGVGIAKDKIESIFLGEGISKSGKADSNKGMGIGLSICKTIINAHDGEIWANYHEEGAEIVFSLKEEK